MLGISQFRLEDLEYSEKEDIKFLAQNLRSKFNSCTRRIIHQRGYNENNCVRSGQQWESPSMCSDPPRVVILYHLNQSSLLVVAFDV